MWRVAWPPNYLLSQAQHQCRLLVQSCKPLTAAAGVVAAVAAALTCVTALVALWVSGAHCPAVCAQREQSVCAMCVYAHVCQQLVGMWVGRGGP